MSTTNSLQRARENSLAAAIAAQIQKGLHALSNLLPETAHASMRNVRADESPCIHSQTLSSENPPLEKPPLERHCERGAVSTPQAVPDPAPVVIALSGGADSIALFHGALHWAHEHLALMQNGVCQQSNASSHARIALPLIVAHVNHHLRPSSDRDEEFCRRLCVTYGVPLYVEHLGPCPTGQNVEQWARSARYTFFEKVRLEHGGRCTLTAHHADDVVETLLIRILANKEPRSILRVDPARRLVRPLLTFRRGQILEYLRTHAYEFVHDESNDDCSYTRNRVRHELLPFIQEHFGTSTWTNLHNRALALAEDSELLALLADQVVGQVTQHPWFSSAWLKAMKAQLSATPTGLHVHIVERCMYPHLNYRLGRQKALEVLEVWQGQRVAVQLPGAMELRRSKGALQLSALRGPGDAPIQQPVRPAAISANSNSTGSISTRSNLFGSPGEVSRPTTEHPQATHSRER